jgi:hypothetical protein
MARRIITKATADRILDIVRVADEKARARTQKPSLNQSGIRARREFTRLQATATLARSVTHPIMSTQRISLAL